MATTFKKVGYGQVEPNHLSAQKTGQTFAQLPVKSSIEVLENGQFIKYDMAAGECNYSGDGEWLLVYNEVKLYKNEQTKKDFALKQGDYVDGSDPISHNGVGPFNGQMYSRNYKTNIGDIFTTNMLKDADYTLGDKLAVGTTGVLEVGVGTEDIVWKIVKIYTLADGQPAVKIQRIK